jgi:hypothetical protein
MTSEKSTVRNSKLCTVQPLRDRTKPTETKLIKLQARNWKVINAVAPSHLEENHQVSRVRQSPRETSSRFPRRRIPRRLLGTHPYTLYTLAYVRSTRPASAKAYGGTRTAAT